MTNQQLYESFASIETLGELAKHANYSFMDLLQCDPDATIDGADFAPRQVFSGHYVPVIPTPIEEPEYVSHSKNLFCELGFADSMATTEEFVRLFSGDLRSVPAPMRRVGWACGYALSIYGTEYIQQCPFQTGNGYGDGRAISVLEGVINGRRLEMQLKGGGRTPYCRGADGRAVLRSSIREFLAQEHMHALGVPTSRSLSLYVSKSEKVKRRWYSDGSRSSEPDRLISEPVAITTRVAPSFIRVGQLELFGRRAQQNAHPKAMQELEKIVLHLIDREYAEVIDKKLDTKQKVLLLAREFRSRLTLLVANWIRVGYCQGNFNSDNCAAGGFTLDYGPYGFCEVFDPYYQPWTGGGRHYSFLNQPVAAQRNFDMFCKALQPLLTGHPECLVQLDEIRNAFADVMRAKLEQMWAAKLGLEEFNAALFKDLIVLMLQTPIDYTIFFRELSTLPDDIGPLKKSFYDAANGLHSSSSSPQSHSQELDKCWTAWLKTWKSLVGIDSEDDANDSLKCSREEIAREMKRVNPKYSLREWMVMPAYQQAASGDYCVFRRT